MFSRKLFVPIFLGLAAVSGCDSSLDEKIKQHEKKILENVKEMIVSKKSLADSLMQVSYLSKHPYKKRIDDEKVLDILEFWGVPKDSSLAYGKKANGDYHEFYFWDLERIPEFYKSGKTPGLVNTHPRFSFAQVEYFKENNIPLSFAETVPERYDHLEIEIIYNEGNPVPASYIDSCFVFNKEFNLAEISLIDARRFYKQGETVKKLRERLERLDVTDLRLITQDY